MKVKLRPSATKDMDSIVSLVMTLRRFGVFNDHIESDTVYDDDGDMAIHLYISEYQSVGDMSRTIREKLNPPLKRKYDGI